MTSHSLIDPRPEAVAQPALPEGELSDRRDRFGVLEQLSHATWIFDFDRLCIHWANRQALKLWRADTLEALVARDLSVDLSDTVARRLHQYQSDLVDTDTRFTECWTIYPEGRPCAMLVEFSGIRLGDGRLALFCEHLADHGNNPAMLRSTEALTHTTVMITLYSRAGGVLYSNPAAREAAPAGREQRHRFVREQDYHALMLALHLQGRCRLIAPVLTSRGERWHEVSGHRCRDAVTGEPSWLISEVDVSDLKRTEARAQHLADHDALTGLPNRHYVTHGFQHQLESIGRAGEQAALIFIDLDRFKHVNDSLGHAAGDELLVEMANRLRSAVRHNDRVARLGGDEFLVLATADDIAGYVEQLSSRLLKVLSQPGAVRNTEVQVTPSLGVSIYPQDGTDIHTLMRHADLAMYRAKDAGRNRVAYFAPEMTAAAQKRLTMESELRHALERREFVVYYQPRVDVRSNRICGAEALVRWQHPKRGLIAPGVFISYAEDCGLIGELGAQVLEIAARQQARWQAQGLDLAVSVNLSPRQFLEGTLVEEMRRTVEATGCDPRRIELEITESVLLGNDDSTVETLEQLAGMGFRIAVDDFGTGYSNLAYLQRYPIDCLKIDRSFISKVVDSAQPIAGLIITMCRMLGVQMVAEGVETQSQLDWLKQQDCHQYQGYLFSHPLPATAFEALLPGRLEPAAGGAD
ncbi:diguanylate cyclase/phosphodiesterase [Sphaerotilus hippei]|uniref:Diguanylate cyclase/phosphodiesterase n=1 Tax=Sphaerotilus hippei TaxID=744406 RepID=A0A318H0U4_9BURK|nr:EAL domain-containing protein [Sphaerotilus hippei]PXW95809.1 diguanylate cyclase/phosphodiesterase [Sphaerotilus hippei]